MNSKTDSANGFKQLASAIKAFVELKIDYLKVVSVEKLTKLISKILISIISVVLILAVLFFLLFALAYALAPVVGFIASFAIIAGIFLLILIVVFAFRKTLFINPLLKLMVDLFYDETKEKVVDDENNATTV